MRRPEPLGNALKTLHLGASITWSALCNGRCVRYTSSLETRSIWIEGVRRGLDYVVAFGLALLSSHFILQGRW